MIYASWEALESLVTTNDNALQAVAKKYPELMMKWTALRKRMGKNCPMARAVLKLIVMYEGDNKAFINSVETGTWNDGQSI